MTAIEHENISHDELEEAWPVLSEEDRVRGFVLLSWEDAAEFFSHLSARDKTELVLELPEDDRRRWLRSLPPDDIADIVQEAPDEDRERILGVLDAPERQEATELLEYDEDDAGGLMTPRYARLRADMSVGEAISYLRRQSERNAEIIYYAYVLDSERRLVGVVSFRQLVMSSPTRVVRDLITTDVVSVPDDMDQEEVSRVFAHEDLLCLPVVDSEGRMKGIVTADDIVDVVEQEATEDIHKIGGSEALEAPYLQVGFVGMMRKRGVWLIALLLLGFFTVEAMGRFEESLRDLAVLALFIPLIISCGGNTGSQASTLVVRAMALDEVRLRDWWLVIRREVLTGLGLGALLGGAGMVAALLWNAVVQRVLGESRLGEAPVVVSLAVAISILCVVLWGTIAGAMLPFVLRRCGADPASASAPLVATIVDVSGLVLYFRVAGAVVHALSG